MIMHSMQAYIGQLKLPIKNNGGRVLLGNFLCQTKIHHVMHAYGGMMVFYEYYILHYSLRGFTAKTLWQCYSLSLMGSIFRNTF